MGILAMNIVAFADVPAAYFNPLAQTVPTVRTGDLLAYAGNFLLFDGKMRGLFSFLFGASLLLLSEKDGARRRPPPPVLAAAVRSPALLPDLVGRHPHTYALIGFLALAFRNAGPRALIISAVVLIFVQFALYASMTFYALELQGPVFDGTATAGQLREWEQLNRDTIMPSARHRVDTIALYLGPWTTLVHHQLTEKTFFPLAGLFAFGWETLAYMLLGMAALKSGLLTGAWEDRRYRRWALARSGRSPGWPPCGRSRRVGAAAAEQRIGRLVEQLDGLVEQLAQLDHVGDQLVGEAVGLDAQRAVVSISSATLASGSAPNWRASPLMVWAGITSATVFCSRIACSICATDLAPRPRGNS
jgi:hypothetical protein